MAPKKADDKKKAEKPASKDTKTASKDTKEPASGGSAMEKPQKPDEAAFQARLDVVKEKIDKLKAAQEKLTKEINEKNTGKEDYEKERQALYEELSAVKADKEERMAALKGLKDSEAERRREEKDTKSRLNTLEKSLSSEEEIDKSIQEIELKMSTTTMSLKEEKELMNKIKKLKATRPEVQRKVKEYEAIKAKCESTVAPTALSVKEQIDNLQKDFSEKAEKHNEIYAKITALKEKRTLSMGDVTALIDKKNKLKEEIMGLQEERNVIWNEKKDQMRKYNEWDKQQRLLRKKEMEARWQAEEAERAAKNAAWELEKPNPYLAETTLLEQTIDYCKQILGGDDKAEVAAKANPSDWKAPVEGAQVMMSKKDREDEFFFAPTKAKKGQKGKKKEEGDDSAAKKKIKHTAETFKIFSELKLPAPVTHADIGPLMQKLESSLAEYNVKVKKWEDERKRKIEEAEKNKNAEAAPAAEAAA